MNIKRIVTLGGTLLGAAGLLALSACGSQTAANSENSAGGGQVIKYTIVGADDGNKGPDGKTHDTFSTKDSTSITAGSTVTLKFENADDAQHSFTLPDLGINVIVPGAKDDSHPGTTSYTFTASKTGTFRWYCAIPCDTDNNGWAMKTSSAGNDQDGFMAGTLTVK